MYDYFESTVNDDDKITFRVKRQKNSDLDVVFSILDTNKSEWIPITLKYTKKSEVISYTHV